MPIKSNYELLQFSNQTEFGNYMLETILKGHANKIVFNGTKREFKINLKHLCDKENNKCRHADQNVMKQINSEYIIIKKK